MADPSWKRELIEDAYVRALSAQERFARGAPFAPPDSVAAALTRGYETGLDRVTLQSRAALAMIAVDAVRARELFEWIDFDLPDAACEELLVPALDGYYETLASIARSSFGGSFDARVDALWFLELYFWRASRPTEMSSVARAVLRYRPSPIEVSYVENVVRGILQHGARDPRSFSTAGSQLLSRVADLDTYGRGVGASGNTLLHSLRDYLVRQTSGPRCADSMTEGPLIDSFNRLVAPQRAGSSSHRRNGDAAVADARTGARGSSLAILRRTPPPRPRCRDQRRSAPAPDAERQAATRLAGTGVR